MHDSMGTVKPQHHIFIEDYFLYKQASLGLLLYDHATEHRIIPSSPNLSPGFLDAM